MSSPPHPQSETPQILVLASSSPYRRALLGKLGIPFQWAAPEVDESARDGETAQALCIRLGLQKAAALSGRFPGTLIVASDQVAELAGNRFGKPGTRELAAQQLKAASGNRVDFFTSVCVIDTRNGETRWEMDTTSVRFRTLNERQIAAYLDREQPYDCAGSFKSEGLGIALMESLQTEDPNALIGLPLIRLVGLLQGLGISIL